MPPKKNRQAPAEDKDPDQQKQADEPGKVDDHAGNDMLKAEKGVTPGEAIAQMDASGPVNARGAVPAETAGTQSVRPKRPVRIKLPKRTGAETVGPAANGQGSAQASGATGGSAIQGINVGPQNVAPKDWALYQKFRRADVQATIARVTAALHDPRHQELERARRENEKEKRREAEKVKLRKEKLKRHQEAIRFAAATPRNEVQDFPLPRPTGYA